jgi:hypothetical protein
MTTLYNVGDAVKFTGAFYTFANVLADLPAPATFQVFRQSDNSVVYDPSSTLSEAFTIGNVTLSVTDISDFATSGYCTVWDGNDSVVYSYSGQATGSLTGVSLVSGASRDWDGDEVISFANTTRSSTGTYIYYYVIPEAVDFIYRFIGYSETKPIARTGRFTGTFG